MEKHLFFLLGWPACRRFTPLPEVPSWVEPMSASSLMCSLTPFLIQVLPCLPSLHSSQCFLESPPKQTTSTKCLS